jgi:hypothetical protein
LFNFVTQIKAMTDKEQIVLLKANGYKKTTRGTFVKGNQELMLTDGRTYEVNKEDIRRHRRGAEVTLEMPKEVKRGRKAAVEAVEPPAEPVDPEGGE